MSNAPASRRPFLAASTATAAVAEPRVAVAEAAGVKPCDLPDLTIQEVRVYNVGSGGAASPIAGIITRGGIEGNYTLCGRYWHPNWSNLGWLEYAKPALVGRSVLDLPALTSQWKPELRRLGQLSYASAIDICLWDALGKAVNLPGLSNSRRLPRQGEGVRQLAAPRHSGKIS
jgi:hypothetical protein